MILERFFPDLYIQSIYDLPLAELKEMGIRGLVFDIDNTVAPFDVADPDEKLIDFFAQLFMAVQCDQPQWSYRDGFYTSFFCCLHFVVVLLRILTTF